MWFFKLPITIRYKTFKLLNMEQSDNQILINVNEITNPNKMVQIIELLSFKLDLKTISSYAKDNNLSYNGAKNFRNKIEIGGVNFVCDNIEKNNLPF